MTIHPPKVVIDEKEPFKHALFGREKFGRSLVSILRKVSDNLVIFVNAPWGAGKTTFAEMWLTHVRKQQKLEVIYYDAYSADYFDDPFVSFSGEIIGLTKRLSEEKGLIESEEFKKSAVQVGKRLAGLATKIGLRTATLGAIQAADIDELKTIGSEIATGISAIGSDIIEKKIENYAAEKDALAAFKKSLAKLAAKVRAEQGFPLTIVVDELDRCRPDFALGLLERIKHLFDVEGLAFVLLVNRDQIENYIRAVYGHEVDARAYLLKFGSLFVDLPSQQAESSFQYEPGRKEYCEILYGHHELSNYNLVRAFLVSCAGIYANHFELTLREIEKAFVVLALFYASTQNINTDLDFLVLLLAVLKTKRPVLYQSLKDSKISVSQFSQQSGFKEMKVGGEHFNLEFAIAFLDYCLMSEAELTSATTGADANSKAQSGLAQIKDRWRGNRKQIIPSLCYNLDRFALKL